MDISREAPYVTTKPKCYDLPYILVPCRLAREPVVRSALWAQSRKMGPAPGGFESAKGMLKLSKRWLLDSSPSR